MISAKTLLVAVLVLVCVVQLAQLARTEQPASAPAPAATIGRYQMDASGDWPAIIDTATGDVWAVQPDIIGGKYRWQPVVKGPPIEPQAAK